MLALRPQVRPSCRHWTDLSDLLGSLERCFEACVALDARRQVRKYKLTRTSQADRIRARMAFLGQRLERELDRTTAELLRAEHAARVRRGVA